MLLLQCRRAAWLLLMFAGLMLAGSAAKYTPPSKKKYRIEDGSKLYLKGTSNVNTFNCDCEDQYKEQVMEAEYHGGYARFKNAELVLQSKNFDCHNRKIDADMQKALQADRFPHIKIALVDTSQDPKCLNGGCKDWFDVKANVNIRITNVTKSEFVTAKAKVLGPNRVQVVGEKAIQMSAYGIKPPEAMLGMIKVNDWISIHFDMVVQVTTCP